MGYKCPIPRPRLNCRAKCVPALTLGPLCRPRAAGEADVVGGGGLCTACSLCREPCGFSRLCSQQLLSSQVSQPPCQAGPPEPSLPPSLPTNTSFSRACCAPEPVLVFKLVSHLSAPSPGDGGCPCSLSGRWWTFRICWQLMTLKRSSPRKETDEDAWGQQTQGCNRANTRTPA